MRRRTRRAGRASSGARDLSSRSRDAAARGGCRASVAASGVRERSAAPARTLSADSHAGAAEPARCARRPSNVPRAAGVGLRWRQVLGGELHVQTTHGLLDLMVWTSERLLAAELTGDGVVMRANAALLARGPTLVGQPIHAI